MLNSKKQALISVIKGGIQGGSITLPSDFNLETAISFAQRHQICSIMLYGLLAAGFKSDEPQMKQLFSCALTETVIHEHQQVVSKTVFSAFEEAGIDYMPLKGSLLKELYPKPELRVMSDTDILIKTEQYDKVSAVLQSLGFTLAYESNHEIVWKRASDTIELHKFLMPSYNTYYYEYFSDAWSKAAEVSPYRYRLKQNDEFIFTFTHFAKHYRDGGIGIKHFIDLWLLLSKNDLDIDYIVAELKKIRLDVFFFNVQKALETFFENSAQSSETSELIINNLIDSGVYGKKENRKNAYAIRSAGGHKVGSIIGRLSVIRKMLFPPRKSLCKRYSVLEKAPILLPFCWLLRIVQVIFHPRRVGRSLQAVKQSSSKQVISMENELKKVGLDFK